MKLTDGVPELREYISVRTLYANGFPEITTERKSVRKGCTSNGTRLGR